MGKKIDRSSPKGMRPIPVV